MRTFATGILVVAIQWIIYAPVTAFLPGFQIWFMLLSRWMGWWPEPGIFWFDWLMALVLPGYALFQTVFG